MSRIGKKPIKIPEGVEVNYKDQVITVKGKKGSLTNTISKPISVKVQKGEIVFTRPNDSNKNKALHGTSRANVANMVEGVTKGFEKKLQLVGVGYRASLQGEKLVLTLGFSHPVEFSPRKDIEVSVPDANHISIKGISKQDVGDFAAEIHNTRSPEPYKGKGIRYDGERVILKEGKSGK